MRVLLRKAGDEVPDDAVAVKIGFVESFEELELAEHLARKSFKEGKNIAKKFKYEFLLWLSGTRDIKNALKKTAPEGEHLLVIFSGLDEIKGKRPGLRKKAEPLAMEKISLSRI